MRVEVASISKPGRQMNEDLAVVLGNVVAVLDGASVPDTLQRCCARDARWYVEHLASALVTQLVEQADRPLPDALAGAIALVTTEHRGSCAGEGVGPSAAIAIARVGVETVDYLVLGDCTLVADVAGEVSVVSDSRLSAVASEIRQDIRRRLATGGTYDSAEHRADVQTLVREQAAVRNSSTGYWIAADDPGAAARAIAGAWRAGDVVDLALVTDGAARVVDVFSVVSSWTEFINALRAQRGEDLLARLRDKEVADADGICFPRTSGSDDATLLYLGPDGRA